MDVSEIPVLTKKVQSPANEASVVSASQVDMAALVAQVKQSVLAELTEQWSTQIAEQVTAQVQQRMAAQAEREREMLSEYAQLVQQSIESDARAHVGDSIQAVESAFREALTSLGQQQIKQVEEQCTQLWLAQQTDMSAKAQALNEEMLAALTLHSKQLQIESKKILSTEHAAVESQLTDDYRQSLEKAFAEFASLQTVHFKQQFTAELPEIQAAMDTKVNGLVQAQMSELEKQLNSQLKLRILEVLQGIRFVMPTV